MVLKYSKGGAPYREPPYSPEELREIERTLYGPPITVVRGSASASPAAPVPAPGTARRQQRQSNRRQKLAASEKEQP
jgi:hypothetical protein